MELKLKKKKKISACVTLENFSLMKFNSHLFLKAGIGELKWDGNFLQLTVNKDFCVCLKEN